jgi:two-component system chemotaxis response regulator CheB
MRYSISQHLGGNPEIEVIGTARDGQDALECISTMNPDVVTLDVEMPKLDGISTLRQIMARFPRPVVMMSSLTREGSATTIQALTLGAVDFIAKPNNAIDIRSVLDEAAAKIIRAARARVRPVLQIAPLTPSLNGNDKTVRPRRHSEPVLVIGSSTGGPRALFEVVTRLPANLAAPVLVVQHMPAGFTNSLAERLNANSQLLVKEAKTGDRLMVGQVLVAPGGFHMVLDENEQISLNQNNPVHGVRPSVDVTLTSIIQRFGKQTITAILTGMGSDGTNGSVLLHSLGGVVIAEHESTCVVWGMPRSVTEAGAANFITPLPEIAGVIEREISHFTGANP